MGICPGSSSRCMILSCYDFVSVLGEAAQEPKSLRLGTFAPLRCCNGLSQVERSHEPELGLFPGDGGLRVGLRVTKTFIPAGFRVWLRNLRASLRLLSHYLVEETAK